MEIVMHQLGGLGNQLFQYAALRYYAKRYHADMRIAVEPAWKAISYGYPRPFLLSHFSIAAPVQERSTFERLLLSPKPWLNPPSTLIKKALHTQVFVEQASRRYRFLKDVPLEQRVERLHLRGLWHTYKIVEEIAGHLRCELDFKQTAQGRNRELLEQIKRTRNPVSLHVRRGDITLPATDRASLPGWYHRDAISNMQQRLVDPTFFVFSDDLAFVKENMPQGARMVFVDHNDDFSAHEDLRLMSSCHHHIIANSTFSWWGAWLNPRSDKIVIAPKHWYLKANTYYPDLLPQTWQLADVALAS